MENEVLEDEWKEYAEIKIDGSFPILQERIDRENRINSRQEMQNLMDEELENEHWYWNQLLNVAEL